MNRDQARNLIQRTFTQPFDRQRYATFIGNLLNHLDSTKEFNCNRQYVKDAFKQHVTRYERLATYTTPDQRKVDVLVVYLADDSKLARARTALRNFIADYLKQRGRKDAALVAFVSPSDSAWRFSYVRMEYATVEKPSGEIDAEERLTPARRFSYLVGPAESCHTAQARFLALLQTTDSDPTLAEIEEAFSVEAVTKEFFGLYRSLFLQVRGALDHIAATDKNIGAEFAARKVNTADFAKKLMGQIVFLYFLQRKGWLGVDKSKDWGTGPHDFLRQLAGGKYSPFTNFFNDILEPLFYDTLATDRGHDAFCERFKCRIPFLNGGLFEPLSGYDWRKTDILLPNELFTNSDPVPKEGGITGTGILDVFDRYNFTVNEAEPLEKEVAIDPEMLGKVFENLLEVKERKSKGSFYTPREIVHYMCRESLTNYLDTAVNAETAPMPRADIETLIRSGDQAAHYEAARVSGTKSYDEMLPKTIRTNAKALDDALAAITVCDPAIGSGAFPVGMMQEIVRTRLALNHYFNDVQDRTAYHFKRHAIQNCLYGVDIDPGAVEIAKLRLWLSLVVDEEEPKQIKPLPNLDYKVVVGNSLLGVEKTLFNEQLLSRLEELKPKYFDETDPARKREHRRAIDQIIRDLTGDNARFDFRISFSEVFHSKGGFDVVIGNPPYVSYGLRGGQKMTDGEKQYLKRCFADSAEYKLSLYAIFMELGIRLSSKKSGVSCFIVPDSFVLGTYFSKIRSLILRECAIRQILLLPFKVFGADVGFSVVYLLERRAGNQWAGLLRAIKADSPGDLEKGQKKEYTYPQHYFKNQRRSKFRLFFEQSTFEIVEKCREHSASLGSVITISSGLIGIDGKAAITSVERHGNKWLPGILSGAQVHSFYVEPAEAYILFDKARIKSGYEGVDYSSPKLLIRQTGDSLICAFDPTGLLCLNNVHVCNSKSRYTNLKLICALLNSRLLNFFYRATSLEAGRVMPQTDIEALDDLPVKFDQGIEIGIGALAEKIIAAKNSGPEADTTALEHEIDQLVYNLYGLTPEEIAIVESATAPGTPAAVRQTSGTFASEREQLGRAGAESITTRAATKSKRAKKTAVATTGSTAVAALFATMSYPVTEADRAICAAALAAVEQSNGLNSMDHLDALLLATHPAWCRVFLATSEQKRLDIAVTTAPATLFVGDSDSIRWKDARDHLEQRKALAVDHSGTAQPISPGADLAAVKATLPAGVDEVVALALKALERVHNLRQQSITATQEQQRILSVFRREAQSFGLAAA